MLLVCRSTLKLPQEHEFRESKTSLDISAQLQPIQRVHNINVLSTLEPITRITEMLGKVKLSVSSYDTAWVAMVPSKNSPHKPAFPKCLDWVMENQHQSGSWGLQPSHPLLVKDLLSSTLACVLALHKWNIGGILVKNGLEYVKSNCWAATDKKQITPIGFDIIFPGMIEYANDMGLNLPLDPDLVNVLLHKRDVEVESALRSDFKGKKGHLGYVAEGLSKEYDWKEVMKHQRSNGSLFNSPSTTAAALIHKHDDKCFEYLCLLLKNYDNAVPTFYPLDIYTQLCMIDSLERLATDRYFRDEITSVLDDIYRCWLQRNEDIFLDITCCAMAFRLLRMNGYEVFSDALVEFSRQENFFNSVSAQFNTIRTILELYKASQTIIFQKEHILEAIEAWTSSFLKEEVLKGSLYEKRIREEVDYALTYRYANLEQLESRRSIELHSVDNMQILKTSYRSPSINNRTILEFAIQDFNMCQAIYREEFKQLERWVKDSRLDQLKYARQKLTYCYFSTAAILFAPQLSEARISMTKNCVLATVGDDFFDVGSSTEEQQNMLKLFEKLEGHLDSASIGYCSEQVQIIFSTLQNTVNEFEAKASAWQGRRVEHHIIEIWHNLLKSTMREAEWVREKLTPTMDEYLANASISFGMGPIVLIPLYFLGPNLSEEVVTSAEYNSLYQHISIVGRLLNDLASVKREGAQGKLNSVSLRVLHSQGVITEEEAMREMRGLIESHRRELLRKVLQPEGSVVPKACKDLFWKKTKVLHFFYKDKDGYSCPHEMVNAAKAILGEPISLPHFQVD